MRTDRHFLVRPRTMINPIGVGLGGMGMKRAIRPISVSHLQSKASKLGMIGGKGVLLLSDGLGTSDITGSGFGVRSHNPQLLDKLSNLSLKSVQGKLPKRKNVSLIL
jgi:hypothetical protein